MTRDFEDERPAGTDKAWWGWKPQKAALEYLWRTGELAIAGRVSFHKVYDLAERVLPAAHAAPRGRATRSTVDWACRSALERLGRRQRRRARRLLARRLPAGGARLVRAGRRRAGRSSPVQVEAADGSRPRASWAVPDWQERAAALPPAPPRVRLLSPFDPILRDRKRTLRLFDFDYRFEAFVPERAAPARLLRAADPRGRAPDRPARSQAPPRRAECWRSRTSGGSPGCARARGGRPRWRRPSTGW